MHDVVGLDVSALDTAREAAAAVSGHQGPALSPVGEALGTAQIENLEPFAEHRAHRCVAGHAPGGVGIERRPVVEVNVSCAGVDVQHHEGALVAGGVLGGGGGGHGLDYEG